MIEIAYTLSSWRSVNFPDTENINTAPLGVNGSPHSLTIAIPKQHPATRSRVIISLLVAHFTSLLLYSFKFDRRWQHAVSHCKTDDYPPFCD